MIHYSLLSFLPLREIMVVARGDDAAMATVAGFTFITGIMCADLCCTWLGTADI